MKTSFCPGCGLVLESINAVLDDRYNASAACRRIYDELSAFTLEIADIEFTHQLAVDAYAAQHAGPKVKPISTAFALAGLYLTFEDNLNGRAVQRTHMRLGQVKRQWPVFIPPRSKSQMTVQDVVTGLSADNYHERIRSWGKAVWADWEAEHVNVRRMLEQYLEK